MHRAELASIHSQIQSAFLVVETAKYPEVGTFKQIRPEIFRDKTMDYTLKYTSNF